MAKRLEQASQLHEMYCHGRDADHEFEPRSSQTWGA